MQACFAGTVSRVGGLTFDDLQRETNARFDAAAAVASGPSPRQLPDSGETCWRPGGEDHLVEPSIIFALQTAVRTGSQEAWRAYDAIVNRPGRAVTLRNLLAFDPAGRTPVPLAEVEPASAIVRRLGPRTVRHELRLRSARGPTSAWPWP